MKYGKHGPLGPLTLQLEAGNSGQGAVVYPHGTSLDTSQAQPIDLESL